VQRRPDQSNQDLGGSFKTRSLALRHSLRLAELRFERFGKIDIVSDLPIGTVALLDFDDKKPERMHVNEINSIFRVVGLRYSCIRFDRTTRGWHVVCYLTKTLSDIELIALQSILGDDHMRSALNFMRYRQMKGKRVPKFWRQRSNILYSEKQ
jgi:hypothetical protein